VLAKWMANAPQAFINQCIGNFGTIERFGIDVRDQDGLKVNTGSCTMFLKKYASSFETILELTPAEC
jgi:hypothetical protein